MFFLFFLKAFQQDIPFSKQIQHFGFGKQEGQAMEWMAIKVVAEISKLGSQILAEGVQNKNMNLPF